MGKSKDKSLRIPLLEEPIYIQEMPRTDKEVNDQNRDIATLREQTRDLGIYPSRLNSQLLAKPSHVYWLGYFEPFGCSRDPMAG